MASMTSLKPMANAEKVGVSNPTAAIGMAIMLYANAQNKFCLIVKYVCFPNHMAYGK